MRNQTQLNHLAQEAYQAYAQHRDWTGHGGVVIPFWDEVDSGTQAGWEAAVRRVQELTS